MHAKHDANLSDDSASVNRKSQQIPEQSLSDYSEKDKPWDTHRSTALAVEAAWADDLRDFGKYAKRIYDCSGLLHFGNIIDTETGEVHFRLKQARFCKVRLCPVCQWRRSLMYKARFLEAIPAVIEAHPKHRFILLTLTTRNCGIKDVRAHIKAMNSAWNRLRLRREFKKVDGWIRATEVTRGRVGDAHPHFHVLLMVKPSYFEGQSYVKQARWSEVWGEVLRANYMPIVDVRVIKPNERKGTSGLEAVAAEVLKYSTKPADLAADPEWLRELTRQIHHLRFIASGGAFKKILKADDLESDQDLVGGDDDDKGEHDDGSRIAFSFRRDRRKYYRDPGLDLGPEDA